MPKDGTSCGGGFLVSAVVAVMRGVDFDPDTVTLM